MNNIHVHVCILQPWYFSKKKESFDIQYSVVYKITHNIQCTCALSNIPAVHVL